VGQAGRFAVAVFCTLFQIGVEVTAVTRKVTEVYWFGTSPAVEELYVHVPPAVVVQLTLPAFTEFGWSVADMVIAAPLMFAPVFVFFAVAVTTTLQRLALIRVTVVESVTLVRGAAVVLVVVGAAVVVVVGAAVVVVGAAVVVVVGAAVVVVEAPGIDVPVGAAPLMLGSAPMRLLVVS
jgi:hypothetical protein